MPVPGRPVSRVHGLLEKALIPRSDPQARAGRGPGRRAVIGRGVWARECVIAENVLLGDRSQIMERSILGDNVVVGAGETVEQDAKLAANGASP